MRYRELFKLGWALTWREMAWCTVVCVPAVMVIGLIFAALGLEKATNPAVFIAAFVFTGIVVALFLALPRVLRAVISARYNGFHIAVRRSSPTGGSNRLSYGEAVQVAFFVGLTMLAVEAAVYLALPGQGSGAISRMAVGLLVANPAISAIMLRTPYRGFRLDIVREA